MASRRRSPVVRGQAQRRWLEAALLHAHRRPGTRQGRRHPCSASVHGSVQPACVPNPGTTECSGDAFVTKIDPSGSSIVYSTYLGGPYFDGAAGIAVDAAGNAYVSGLTFVGFPTTPGSFQPDRLPGTGLGTGATAFVSKLTPSGLAYSTYLGARWAVGKGIAVDAHRSRTGTRDLSSDTRPGRRWPSGSWPRRCHQRRSPAAHSP